METLVIEWRRADLAGRDPYGLRDPVASAMRITVKTPQEASRVFNALGAVLRALTTDQDPPVDGRWEVEPRDSGQAVLDPRDG